MHVNRTNLKIAIVLNTAWNIYNYRLGLIRALIAAGHEVVAIAPPDEFVPQIVATGCTFVPTHKLSRKGTNPVKDWQYSQELYKIYKAQAIDIALQYTIKPNIYGSMAAGRAGIKSISTVTGLGYSFLSDGLVNKIAKLLYKKAFSATSLVAFQNRDDQALFQDLGLCPAQKTTLIKGSGINTTYFCPLPKTQENSDLIYLFVGRLLYDKGVVELLAAARQLKQEHPATQFWIVGAIDQGNPSAISEEMLQEYIADSTINYLGQSDDVRSIMQNADVVVLPSYREGLPRVMLESLAMAKPIVTTDVAGCREVIQDTRNGFLVPVKDSTALAIALQKMYECSPAQRSEMGKVGRQMALDIFDEQAIINRYFEEIEKLTS